ncbi:MAG TPA: XRE family transcriptional regulator [Arsenophonus nasoniae]|uniref:XRE family transcriptional regulator n=1 Tax=Arsenophonus nasoniae TaxID=638 RepID=UPI0038794035
MRIIKKYTPPTPEDLKKLKNKMSFTGNQMAELCGLSGANQWRKYTGGEKPRTMNQHILFFVAAQLALNEDELNKILTKMQNLGASLSIDDK